MTTKAERAAATAIANAFLLSGDAARFSTERTHRSAAEAWTKAAEAMKEAGLDPLEAVDAAALETRYADAIRESQK
jgi:hypothetical protein